MVRVDLKGVAKVTSKGRVYWYAWRGGPRLKGEPGSPEFVASYHDAYATLYPADNGTLAAVVTMYRANSAFTKLAASTQRQWRPWLDRIADYFGSLTVAQFDRPQKIRPIIARWRDQYATTPRTADYGMQVLSALLSYAADLGKIANNPVVGMKKIYSADRAAIIWTDADIAAIKRFASPEIAWAVDLAAHTGLRKGDLIRLAWSHVGDDAIVMTTGKSRHRREVVIPLYEDLRAVLACIPRRSPTILTSAKKAPWSSDGLSSSFNKAKHAAGLGDRDLHFHDLRGTAATRFYAADLKLRVIAEIMGWEEEAVEKIIRRYVDRTAATRAAIHQLKSERRT